MLKATNKKKKKGWCQYAGEHAGVQKDRVGNAGRSAWLSEKGLAAIR